MMLATFVLFTLSLKRIQSLDLDLPESVLNTQPSEEPTVIQVSDAGSIYWNREVITMEELGPRLANLKQLEAEPKVLIAGDQNAQFGPAVEVLDAVRLAGIDKVSVETRVRGTGQ